MQLNEALHKLAETYELDADALVRYAGEDTVGGYHSDKAQEKWMCGSIWGVEGQVLYALTRLTRPRFIVNLGTFQGCSSAHIMAAVHATQAEDAKYKPTVVAVDFYQPASLPAGIEFIQGDAFEYVETQMPANRVGLLFEDLYHGVESTRRTWTAFQAKAKSGAFILSHDATHVDAGANVRLGIVAAGILDPVILAIEPADCGLAAWRKP